MSKVTGRGSYLSYFRAMLKAYGPQGWWPARSRFEIVVGAILTQNTAWTNVEKGIDALRDAGLLDPDAMARTPVSRLAGLLRPTGYFNQKAALLLRFLDFVGRCHEGDLDRLLDQPAARMRAQLLEIRGIGPETADAIVLYAGAHPVFVVDAYTRRILERHALSAGGEPYDRLQRRLHQCLPADTDLFKEYHALLVRVGKEHCRKGTPRCDGCPLEPFLPADGPAGLSGRRRPSERTDGSKLEDADPAL